MKHSLLLCYILFALLQVQAQTEIISIFPDRIDTLFQVDASDGYADLVAEGKIRNNTSDTLYIRWQRRVLTTPNGWRTKICDANLCYVEIVDSNIDPDLLLEEPVIIPPFETVNLDVHLIAYGATGTGVVEIELSLMGLPDDVIGVAEYQMEVTTKRQRRIESRKSLRVYPNPSNNYLNVSTSELVKTVYVYNMVGRIVATFAANRSGVYDIGSLPNGIYLVSLVDAQGNVLKTTRVNKKRAISP
ncbi:MAG: T9SS type A sorting domain-containing protein [Bacteroidota bacterium]